MTATSMMPESSANPTESTARQMLTDLSEMLIATTEAIDAMSSRLDNLAEQVHQNECQIFAMGEEVKLLTTGQSTCLDRVEQLTTTLQRVTLSLTEGLT
jgi:uncharacterized coiled-coil protein SlyX